MAKTKHNPERKAFKGRSYKKGGKRIAALWKFEVQVSRTIRQGITIEVEATCAEEAHDLAAEKADDDESGLEWEDLDYDLVVNSVEEVK